MNVHKARPPRQPLAGLMPLALAAAVCAGGQEARAPNTLTDQERSAGWQLLFDGESLEGWRGYHEEEISGWEVVDGSIVRVGPGGDIVTRESFQDFELTLEWKVEPGGNSGVFYRAPLGLEHVYHGAPEMQILDNARHPDGQDPLTSAGANYGLHPAPPDIARPPGEWNRARILVRGNHVEHWLNGRKAVEYELHSEDWDARVEASKFAQWPEYGEAERGRIGLQDHGDRVWFRSIKIRRL